MTAKERTEEIIERLMKIARKKAKPTGFCIGNTAKIEERGFYFTPIRNTSLLVIAGVIVYSEQQAIDITEAIDGRVHYILVDAEKKVPGSMSLSGIAANVERSVRETIRESKPWVYKGNDLAVEAIDGLLSYLTKDSLRGVG